MRSLATYVATHLPFGARAFPRSEKKDRRKVGGGQREALSLALRGRRGRGRQPISACAPRQQRILPPWWCDYSFSDQPRGRGKFSTSEASEATRSKGKGRNSLIRFEITVIRRTTNIRGAAAKVRSNVASSVRHPPSPREPDFPATPPLIPADLRLCFPNDGRTFRTPPGLPPARLPCWSSGARTRGARGVVRPTLPVFSPFSHAGGGRLFVEVETLGPGWRGLRGVARNARDDVSCIIQHLTRMRLFAVERSNLSPFCDKEGVVSDCIADSRHRSPTLLRTRPTR